MNDDWFENENVQATDRLVPKPTMPAPAGEATSGMNPIPAMPRRSKKAKARARLSPTSLVPSLLEPGHENAVTQRSSAGLDPLESDGHPGIDTQKEPAIGTPGQSSSDIHTWPAGPVGDSSAQTSHDAHYASSPVVADLISFWRVRQRWHRAEKSLILQGKAMCRAAPLSGGDKVKASALFDLAADGKLQDVDLSLGLSPFLSAIEKFEKERAFLEKQIEKLATSLPVWPAFGKAVRGFGPLSLAGLIGEAGDLSNYANPAKLWKRFGVAVIDGERQRRHTDKLLAEVHGFNPARRAVLWNVGNGLIGAMGRGPRPGVGEDISARDDWTEWQRLFVQRMRLEAERDPDQVREPVANAKTGEIRESFSRRAAARAKRYVEKQFLIALWRAWRDCSGDQSVSDARPASVPTAGGGRQNEIDAHWHDAPAVDPFELDGHHLTDARTTGAVDAAGGRPSFDAHPNNASGGDPFSEFDGHDSPDTQAQSAVDAAKRHDANEIRTRFASGGNSFDELDGHHEDDTHQPPAVERRLRLQRRTETHENSAPGAATQIQESEAWRVLMPRDDVLPTCPAPSSA